MHKTVAALPIALAIAGCNMIGAEAPQLATPAAAAPDPSYRPPADKAALEAARRAVAAGLKDPPSARFSGLVRRTVPNARGEATDVVCGQVNARNSFGGFTGATPFVYFVQRGEATVGAGDPLNVTVVGNFCGTPAR